MIFQATVTHEQRCTYYNISLTMYNIGKLRYCLFMIHVSYLLTSEVSSNVFNLFSANFVILGHDITFCNEEMEGWVPMGCLNIPWNSCMSHKKFPHIWDSSIYYWSNLYYLAHQLRKSQFSSVSLQRRPYQYRSWQAKHFLKVVSIQNFLWDAV